MKKLIETIKKLSFAVKVQLIIAILCTMAVPAFAWFVYQDRIETFSKIKEPPSINLASGGDDPALYISLENIDVSKSTEKYIVFSVEPGKYSAYDIQLSHTTNIPFTYELYRIQEDDKGLIEYIDHTRDVNAEEMTIKYKIMTMPKGTAAWKVELKDINPDKKTTGRTLGVENDLNKYNRKNYADTDNVNQYVKPIYSVARRVPQLNENEDGSSARDYFAIKITWTQGANNLTESDANYWNNAYNNKETDLIYISAKQNTTTVSP